MSDERKVFVATLPPGFATYDGSQVMIEQFGDGPLTVAFRTGPHDVWGPPIDCEAR
jgi:hypothetical protein